MILIIDDNQDARELMEAILNSGGYDDLAFAASAKEAYAILELDKAEPTPRVTAILLDISMPEIDGNVACATIRQHPAYGETPIIMVTAKRDETATNMAFMAGATDFISKPLDPVRLLARLRATLQLGRETERRQQREAELNQLRSDAPAAPSTAANTPTIDPVSGMISSAVLLQFIENGELTDAEEVAILAIEIDGWHRFSQTYDPAVVRNTKLKVGRALARTSGQAGDLLAVYGDSLFIILTRMNDETALKDRAVEIRRAVAALSIPYEESVTSDIVTVNVAISIGPKREALPQVLKAIVHTRDTESHISLSRHRDHAHETRR